MDWIASGVTSKFPLSRWVKKTVLEFLNGKQDRNPEIIKLKLWFEREGFLPCGGIRSEFSVLSSKNRSQNERKFEFATMGYEESRVAHFLGN